ncbi:MAG: HAD family phosphatase [Clostridium sp.]|nr:HAD family phosphatase [Clostridium sp.]
MIRLIASDLDGTLAMENGSIPSDTFSCIKELHEKNIQFVVATGRQGITVYETFQPVLDYIYIVADNGAIIYHKGEVVSVTELDQVRAKQLINEMERFPDLDAIICCQNCAYSKDASEDLRELVKTYYRDLRHIDSTDEISEPIVKIAMYAPKGFKPEEEQWIHDNYEEEFLVTVSGAQWIDICNPNISKGIALEMIMKELNVTREEAMAFGDYFNDESMLKAVEEGYAMENAPEEMKKHAKFIAPTNGVLDIIRKKVLS